MAALAPLEGRQTCPSAGRFLREPDSLLPLARQAAREGAAVPPRRAGPFEVAGGPLLKGSRGVCKGA
eukprot:6542270-Pyramimonas_sp.AAC.1